MNDIIPVKPARRSYTAAFKAELVKASQQPGVSVAGLALKHSLNANLLRRWIREHEDEGRHAASQITTAFIPVTLPAAPIPPCQLHLQGKDISATLTLPVQELGHCAELLRQLLR